jgi:hypothetical protein
MIASTSMDPTETRPGRIPPHSLVESPVAYTWHHASSTKHQCISWYNCAGYIWSVRRGTMGSPSDLPHRLPPHFPLAASRSPSQSPARDGASRFATTVVMQRGKRPACGGPLRPVWALRTADIGPRGVGGCEGRAWCLVGGGEGRAAG